MFVVVVYPCAQSAVSCFKTSPWNDALLSEKQHREGRFQEPPKKALEEFDVEELNMKIAGKKQVCKSGSTLAPNHLNLA